MLLFVLVCSQPAQQKVRVLFVVISRPPLLPLMCVWWAVCFFIVGFVLFFAPFIVGGILCFWLGCLRANKEIILQNQHNETPSASSSSWCSLTLLGSHTTPRQTMPNIYFLRASYTYIHIYFS